MKFWKVFVKFLVFKVDLLLRSTRLVLNQKMLFLAALSLKTESSVLCIRLLREVVHNSVSRHPNQKEDTIAD